MSENGMAQGPTKKKLAWLRQVLEWHEVLGEDWRFRESVAEQFSFDAAGDRVYVFTPGGDVVKPRAGRNAIGFCLSRTY